MQRLPKITVKFFLNKKLDPLTEGGKDYPLYIMITFRRQTTQIKSRFGDYYEDLDAVKMFYPEIIATEDRIVRKAIEREVHLKDDRFNLKGFGELYERYSTSVWGMVSARLKEWLKMEMLATGDTMANVPNYDDPLLMVPTLRLAAIRLIPDFDKVMSEQLKAELDAYTKYMRMFPLKEYGIPMTIDWENGEHQKEVKEKYRAVYGDNPMELSTILGMIGKSIT